MPETFAIVLDQNMQHLDGVFHGWERKPSYDLQARPDSGRFGADVAVVIAQDGHNNVFAAVGLLRGIKLQGTEFHFQEAKRFTIPVVLDNARAERSPLVLGKGFMNRFMYLAEGAAERILDVANELVNAPPLE